MKRFSNQHQTKGLETVESNKNRQASLSATKNSPSHVLSKKSSLLDKGQHFFSLEAESGKDRRSKEKERH